MDNKLLGLTIVVVAAFAVFMGFVFFSEPISKFIRASGINPPSTQNSLIFAWPLELPADGKTKSEITIFLRDNEGRGLQGHEVSIQSSIGSVQEGLLTTDSKGSAVFHLTSQTPGVAKIEALVDNTKLQRSITVQFE
ncbi:hypothetical protein A3A93_00335 [Candidatus Roizmanbacteria bacterium RIFCSPLOWO2_01_FULL_38_12]|uniref:Big-1 domain-containing protein n=1 Tax=Candidatus Roizmanbacteria bacterium RIFCSPLOWO2_01_FULL_38_12 TaxID=1802061 RepID=A0A1F7J0T2_9BACT|nr:MAG: hypothetical protein A3F59_05570 [Candidatus Roizmanbacteria bacterium RIFCSPHIGHO2_12_FULL_38_13]OGK49203.1 MAG: hypothetical protein A3A93_00335 [Candidatus Roizmanbacteria bacterium RIFCSPLOWO2_01_FULL_38_12]